MRRNNRIRPHKTSNRLISAVFCILVVAICIVFHSRGNELKAQNEEDKAQIEQLRAEIEEEEQRTQDLQVYSKYVNTMQFVEDMAREKLGLIYPGELIFKSE